MHGWNWMNWISWMLGAYQKRNVFQKTSKSWEIDPVTWTVLQFLFIFCRIPAFFDFNQFFLDYGYPSTLKPQYSENAFTLWFNSIWYVYIWKILNCQDFIHKKKRPLPNGWVVVPWPLSQVYSSKLKIWIISGDRLNKI